MAKIEKQFPGDMSGITCTFWDFQEVKYFAESKRLCVHSKIIENEIEVCKHKNLKIAQEILGVSKYNQDVSFNISVMQNLQ